MKQLRIAIVGMGIGKAQGAAFARNSRSKIAALCDLVPEKMQSYAKELPDSKEIKTYTDYKKMCLDKDIDAVFVGTPNQWHVPIAFEAIKRGKHVMVTKPLADSIVSARKLVQAADASGLVNMMSLNTRFGRECRYLQNLMKDGFFGELYYARALSVRRSGIPVWNLGFIKKGGGAFRDMGVHVLDAAWWLLGTPKPVSVSGIAGAKFGPRGLGYWEWKTPAKDVYKQYASDDYGCGFIKFENGSGIHVESFWASHQPEQFQVELFGTEAGAKLSPFTLYRTVNNAPQDITVNIPASGPDSWDNIANHFLDCVFDGKKCGAPLRHGLIVQEMMEALLKSAETGKEVVIK